ncbi:MAG: hypothetical protein MHPSP_000173 [Paramarteilia canceri]
MSSAVCHPDNELIKLILQERKNCLEENDKCPALFSKFEEYGSKFELKAPKNGKDLSLEFLIAPVHDIKLSSLKKEQIMADIKSENSVQIDFNSSENKVVLKVDDIKTLKESAIDFISRIRFSILKAFMMPVIESVGTSEKKKLSLKFDSLNTLYAEATDNSLMVTYSIQSELAEEDQTLLETFLGTLSSSISQSVLSVRYSKKMPEILKKLKNGPQEKTGMFYVTLNVFKVSLVKTSALEQIFYFHNTVHMHIKAAKNSLNLLNSHYLKTWEQKYNRSKD